MAYVGTATNLGSARDTLASVLQGESSTLTGQTAVANVLMNRADANYSGYGSDVISQATAPRQFQGQQTPTAQAYNLADQVLAGTLPRTLTNSLNYAAPVFSGPGATTAPWAVAALNSGQGVNIGGNVFFVNDKGGTPNYDPGATQGGNNGTATGSGGTNPSDPESGNGPLAFTVGPSGSAAGGGSGSNASGGASGTGSTADNVIGTSASGPVMGAPTVTAAINTAGSNTKSAIDTGAKGIGDATKAAGGLIGSAISSVSSAWSDLFKDYFTRAAFIIFGLVIFGAGLYFFGRPAQQVVQQQIKRAIPA